MPDLQAVKETIAALGMAAGRMPEREKAFSTHGFGAVSRALADAGEALQEVISDSISWGDDADWMQTIDNLAFRVLQYLNKERSLPSAEHLRTLARESIYYFMAPKFSAPMDPQELNLIRGLLTAGMEGGINYWAQIVDVIYPPGTTEEDFEEGGKMQPPGDYYHWAELVPTYPGGAVIINDLTEAPESFERERERLRVQRDRFLRELQRRSGEIPEGPEPEESPLTEEEKAEWSLHTLDLPALQKAWTLLQTKYPKIYKRTLDEDYDASDGDIFIQLAVFGEEIYG